MNANERKQVAGESAVGREVRQAGKHSFIYMLGQALSRAVGFFMIPIYTRLISPADYGVLELVTICGGTLALTISFASSEALSRLFYAEQEQSRRNLVVSTAVIGSAICGLALVAIAIGCLSLVPMIMIHC
jgi:O-antigen/teichoic acid export membrane protein